MSAELSSALEEAERLNDEVKRLYSQAEYAKALPLAERVLSLRREELGEGHPSVATWVNNVALLYQKRGEYAKAEPLFVCALSIYEGALGPEDLGVADVLNNLGVFHLEQDAYTKADPLLKRALQIRERAPGAAPSKVAESLNNLAFLYQARGDYDKAEPLFKRAIEINKEALGQDHSLVARSLNNLALLYEELGAYPKAKALLEDASHALEHTLGPDHPATVKMFSNLAGLYQMQGEYSKAEPLYERAFHTLENVSGPEHPDVATALENLAGVYRDQGAHTKAEPLYLRSLGIRERVHRPEHSSVATSLNNLAGLYQGQGAYDKAAPLFERALRIREEALGPNHTDVATSLNNLARIYQDRGEYAEAELRLKRALHICEKSLGPNAPLVATMLSNLAGIYRARDAYDEAEPLYQRTLQIREEALGLEHPDVSDSHFGLAWLYWGRDDMSHARSHFERAATLQEHHLARSLATLSERRKRLFLQKFHGPAQVIHSFHAHGAPDDGDALALALTMALQRKGRVLEEVTRAQAALWRDLSSELPAEFAALQERRTELVTRRQPPPDPRHADALRALEEDVERREEHLSRKGAAFHAQVDAVTLEAVQTALPRDASLVEFVRYHRFNPQGPGHWEEAHYLAYVLRHERPPQWVLLGKAVPIERAVASALKALTEKRADTRELLRALDELVFAPIRRLIDPTSRFLLSPDGVLHQVPFAALIDEEGRHLVKRVQITYITSGRDLVRLAEQGTPRSKPFVVAAPDYKGRYPSLRGTEVEARAIERHFPEATPLCLGADAKKDVLRGAQSPLFLHVATHGFFGRTRVSTSPHRARSWRRPRDLSAFPSDVPLPNDGGDVEDALDEAVLVFAGANEKNDLTAREIANLDLRGTQLVVLSACETGVGRVAAGEGVYGLRRALAIAGVETQVVSLWKVDDEATAKLMGCYYGRLREGEGRSEALRQAQLATLREPETAHPFYWAAFVPVGEGGPLRLGTTRE